MEISISKAPCRLHDVYMFFHKGECVAEVDEELVHNYYKPGIAEVIIELISFYF
jgi:hypothetical protein